MLCSFLPQVLLFLWGVRTFGNYYKRRINRIYPTVFAWALLHGLCWGSDKGFLEVLISGGGWFVSCIMIYYVALYFVRKYYLGHLRFLLIGCLAISFALYPLFRVGEHFNIYGDTYYKWIFFFVFMLQGAVLGLKIKTQPLTNVNAMSETLKIAGCIVCFYGLCAFKATENYNFLQILSLIPLLCTTNYIYRWCNIDKIKEMYLSTKLGWIMNFTGSLCLEIYLVQVFLFTDKLNCIFPLNIPIIFLAILMLAYILHCAGCIWQQTFSEKDYNWKEVFRFVNY